MKTQLIAALFVLLGLSSCHLAAPKKLELPVAKVKDTLLYTYNTLKQRAPDCGNKPDTECTVAQIEYPVFSGQKTLNDTVRKKLLNVFFSVENGDTSLNKTLLGFIKSYDSSKNSTEPDMFYTLDLYAYVLNQDSSLATLALGGYQFSGGAHGSTQRLFINWDTKAKREINLRDILIAGYKYQLTKVAEHLFRRQEKLSDTVSLADSYFFENGKFRLNHNFSITPTGLNFLYNEYEIKPYSEGMTELLIPYSSIKSLLKTHTVVDQYIK